jgi:HEAT repeat protein
VTANLLAGVVYLVAALMAVSVLTIVVGRGIRRMSSRRNAGAAGRARALLVALVADDDARSPLVELVAVDRTTWRSVEPKAIALLGKLRGEARARLVSVFRRRGVVERAVRDLARPSAPRRARAAELVGLLGVADAVPALCRLLDDRDRQVRVAATRALGAIGDPGAITTLLASLTGRRSIAAQLVADALLRIGADAQPALLATIKDAEPLVRVCVIEVLGLVAGPGAATSIARALGSDPSDEVRVRAATALGRLGTRQVLAVLLRAVDTDPVDRVRAASAVAVGELGDTGAVPALAAALRDPGHRVANGAAHALVRLGEPGRAALRRVVAAASPERAGEIEPAARHAREALAAQEVSQRREPVLAGGPAAAGGR